MISNIPVIIESVPLILESSSDQKNIKSKLCYLFNERELFTYINKK